MQLKPRAAGMPDGARIGSEIDGELRLDVIQQPYGLCPAALEALESGPQADLSILAGTFRKRLGEVYRVPPQSILLLDGIDNCLAGVMRRVAGPLVSFPPSAPATMIESLGLMRQSVAIARGPGHEREIELDCAADIPDDSVAIVDSPSDPLGSLLATTDAVRLARACCVLVTDERYAEFSGMSALPLAAEYDNVIVLRSLETWAGIANPPCAWAVGSSRAAAAVGLEEIALQSEAIVAGIATLDCLESVNGTLKILREERSRLYRLLRKFSFLEPIPSWGPFLSARVNVVARHTLIEGLRRRGIRIHAPSEVGLERIVRIGIGSRPVMERLKWALLDLAPELMRERVMTPAGQFE